MFKRTSVLAGLLLLIGGIFLGGVLASPVTLTGTLPKDHNGRELQVAQKVVFQDATGTPIVSPKTSVGTVAQAFVVPTNAINFIIRGDAALRYGLNSTVDGSASGKGYMPAAANSDTVIPCAGLIGQSIYVRAESGTATVFFMFEILN